MNKNDTIQTKKVFDLKKRTFLFSKNLIFLLGNIKQTPLNRNTISQCIRSGTSIGANYQEADSAESRRDFEHKLGICKKETQETEYWLQLLIETENISELKVLLDEVLQLRKIFITIIKNSKNNTV